MERNDLEIFEKHCLGIGEKHAEVPASVKEKYKGIFVNKKNESDLVSELWEKHGFASYRSGLVSLVNPDEYNAIARKFPNIPENTLVFAKSCVGGLFALSELNVGRSIIYINVHKGTRNIVGTHMNITLMEMAGDSFWKKECYGKIELKVLEKYGPLAYDECYAFIPALALGGKESIANIQKVKVKEHLELLSQLY